jgi:uncharacterized protein (TIGR02118 family)
MVKTFALIARRPDISREQFHAHWMDPHGTLAADITLLRGYVQNHRVAEDVLDVPGDAPYEGIAAVWVDDLGVMAALADDPQMVEATADQPNLMDVDKLGWVLTDEEVVLEGDRSGVKVLHMIRRDPASTPEAFAAAWQADDDSRRVGEELGVVRETRCRALPESYDDAQGPPYDAVHEVWWPDLPSLWSARAKHRDAWDELFGGDVVGTDGSHFIVAQEHIVIDAPGAGTREQPARATAEGAA